MTSKDKDIFWKLNSLASLACGLIGRYTIIDLRNDSTANGKIDSVDGFMNVTMTDVVFTDPGGNEFYFATFFVRDRNIRYIHIPKELQIEDTILRQLYKIKNPRSRVVQSGAAGFKATRLIQRQMETMKRVEEIKKERLRKKREKEEAEASTSKDDQFDL
uniref:U7 snRNA-associated Sm-like protein LSm10 n=1 Tax=Lygus hesperus TaxID=30085 RepID=A0A0A9XHB5_LYGHE